MKWMKYSCPFGGKQYPFYLAMIAPMVIALLLVMGDHAVLAMAAMFLLPIGILVGCFFVEQHLTPDERTIITETDPPLWNPLTEPLMERLRFEAKNTGDSPLPMFLFIGAFPIIFIVATMGVNAVSVVIAAVIVLVIIAFLLAGSHQSEIWSQVDDTAVYIEVPIHHMYDVRHTHSRRHRGWLFDYRERDEWFVSYLVFYLHDGRYILRAPVGAGDAHSVIIVRFGNSTRWLLQ